MKKLFVFVCCALLAISCEKEDKTTPDVSFDLSKNEIKISGKEETVTFDINSDAEWSITTTSDWLAVTPTSGKGKATIEVKSNSNTAIDAQVRNGELTIKANSEEKKVKVEQAVGIKLLSTLSFDITEGSKKLKGALMFTYNEANCLTEYKLKDVDTGEGYFNKYTYNEAKKLVKMELNYGDGLETYAELTYEGNTVIVNEIMNEIVSTYTLNAKGLPEKMSTIPQNTPEKISSEKWYYYNADNTLKETKNITYNFDGADQGNNNESKEEFEFDSNLTHPLYHVPGNIEFFNNDLLEFRTLVTGIGSFIFCAKKYKSTRVTMNSSEEVNVTYLSGYDKFPLSATSESKEGETIEWTIKMNYEYTVK